MVGDSDPCSLWLRAEGENSIPPASCLLPPAFLVETRDDTVTGVTPVVTETAIELVTNQQTDNSQQKSLVNGAVEEVGTRLKGKGSGEIPSQTQYPTGATTPEITFGAKVRVYFPGSKRHDKVGIVARFVFEHGVKQAVVILEDIEDKLKHFLCPLAGSDLMRLDLV
ncbi:hypothetical protein IQ246_27810 [aff. Roholtiella sp. LEGE 12411]|nr:hypothetical protein [aff. Roholtiella sp. LEGE 12411]